MGASVAISLIGMAAAATATGISTGMQIDAAGKAAKESEEQQRRNAALARAQAVDALQRGGQAAGQRIRMGRRLRANALAQSIGPDGAVSYGKMNAAEASLLGTEMDATTIRANAAREAWGFESEAEERSRQAKRTREAGFMSSLSTGIAGGGQIAGQLGNFNWASLAGG